MAQRTMDTLFAGGTFFEGPRWHEGEWWVSDMFGNVVLAIDPSGRRREVMTVAARPSGLGWLSDGSLLVVSMEDRHVLRRSPDGAITVHADISAYCTGWANDMVIDARGRAYVGNFGFDLFAGEQPRPTVLVRVDPDGSASVAADDLTFPNGSVVTPDGKTLIVGETFGSRYISFEIGPDGALSERAVWADLGQTEARDRLGPDGCALDAEGHIWSADVRSGRCLRLAPGGAIVDSIDPPEGSKFYACMLGGEDGRTFLGCASVTNPGAVLRSGSRRAVLVTTRVEHPHAGLP